MRSTSVGILVSSILIASTSILAGCSDSSSAPGAGANQNGGSNSQTPGDTNYGSGGSSSPGSSGGNSSQSDAGANPSSDGGTSTTSGTRWIPKPGTSWQWQLSGTGALDMSFDVDAYDIDLFDNDAATIASLHAAGRKVICYFDTAYEPDRPDSALLAPYEGNAMQGWPGEYWLDVTQSAVVDVMTARIALAHTKACDAIEADDVDSFSNDPGTGITSAEQQTFIRTLAAAAHADGMSYALKSDIDDISAVIGDVDFDIDEECFKYDECDTLTPFITENRAVFEVEYTSGDLATKGATVCPQANSMNLDTLIKHLDLDSARYSCR